MRPFSRRFSLKKYDGIKKITARESQELPPDVLGQIAAGVAHAVRNPLTVIKGYIQLCQKQAAYRTDGTLELMLQEVTAIENVINKLIFVAKNKAIEKAPHNLNQIITEYLPLILERAEKSGIAVKLILEPALPSIIVNQEEIRQLLTQLSSNGLEAMWRKKGRLTIGTARERGQVMLYIRDEGLGIEEEHLKVIFNPFYTTKDGHTGLGLAIGLGIVERHQGDIHIVSRPGGGTTVKVMFPAEGY